MPLSVWKCVVKTNKILLQLAWKLCHDLQYYNFDFIKEMDRALKEIHVDYISTEQVKKLIEVCVTKILCCY